MTSCLLIESQKEGGVLNTDVYFSAKISLFNSSFRDEVGSIKSLEMHNSTN